MERAMALPFSIDPTGSVSSTNDQRVIWQNRVISAVMTDMGERIQRPKFGGSIGQTPFMTASEAAQVVKTSVENSFGDYLPTLTLINVSTSMNNSTGELSATINYKLPSGERGQTLIRAGVLTRTGEIVQE